MKRRVMICAVLLLLPACRSSESGGSRDWLDRTADATGKAVAAPFKWAGTHFAPPPGPTSQPANPATYEAPEALIVARYPPQVTPATGPASPGK